MGKEQKMQMEKPKRIRKKKNVLHYVLVYLVCLLAAFVTWLSVRYSMHSDEAKDACAENSLSVSVSALSLDGENSFYA